MRCTLYRAVYQRYATEPIPSRSSSGRFHDALSPGQTSYLAEDPATAWKEVALHWGSTEQAYRMVEVEIEIQKILDLTDPSTRKRYGIKVEQLVSGDWSACQQLANQLRRDGFQAVRTFSRADQPDGRNVVVFLECLKPSHIKVKRRAAIKPGEYDKPSSSSR
ncbi:MAG: RES family NAD+ phosphorylase [Bryobacteraceae bacterium]